MITTVSDKEIAQAATIEQLRQEVTAWSITVVNLEAELEQKQRDANFWKLTAEVMESVRDALAADAARLEWLSNQTEAYGFEEHEGNGWCIAGPYATLRGAIDAAMQEANHD